MSSDIPNKLLLAARAGLPHLSEEIRSKIGEVLTLGNMAIVAAAVSVDLVASGTPVGAAINVFIGGATVILLGMDAIEGYRHLVSFYRTASTASSEEDFKRAGVEFAKGITSLGIDSALVLLSRRSSNRIIGPVSPAVSSAELEASWFAFIDALEFKVAPNQGILWAKIGLGKAKMIAEDRGPGARIINTLLKEDGFYNRYNAEFVTGRPKEVKSAFTYRIWERASMRYVSALRGMVTAYTDEAKFYKAIREGELGALGAGKGAGRVVELSNGEKVPLVLVTEIEEAISSNPNITSIRLIDAGTGKEIGVYLRPGSSGGSRINH